MARWQDGKMAGKADSTRTIRSFPLAPLPHTNQLNGNLKDNNEKNTLTLMSMLNQKKDVKTPCHSSTAGFSLLFSI
jgi:hypothetical protein